MLGLKGPEYIPPGRISNAVIFLHGLGSNGDDLIGLAPFFAPRLFGTVFLSPNAPYPMAQIGGYQWFEYWGRTLNQIRDDIEHAAPLIASFVNDTALRFNIPHQKIVLCGFSQGTMMALHVGPQRPRRIAGILGFSGLLADPEALTSGPVQKPPVMLIHGEVDDLIPVAAIFSAAQGLAAAEIPVEWHISPGIPHGIGPDGVEIGLTFLKRVLPS